MRKGYIEFFRDKKKEWRVRIKARNRRILFTSEGYKRIASAQKALKVARTILDSVDLKDWIIRKR